MKTPTIVLDLRTVQDHFPGIGRYSFHLAHALAESAPTWRFALLTQSRAVNTRYDMAGLARWPNVTLHPTAQTIFSWQEQITLCLLYTSPSPRDRTRTPMTSSA